MQYLTALLLAAPLAALAAPARVLLDKRAESDILVLKFATVLEEFERDFYKAALAKFRSEDFTAAGFADPSVPIEQFIAIGETESTHFDVLAAALKTFGETPVQGCQFNFDAALTDVATMAATARVVEDTGVSAYIGGATLLTDPRILAAAGSILSIEARHSSILNVLAGQGTAVPSAFDLPMTPNEVLAIAGPFISGCDLGIKANPSLSVTNTGPIGPGTKLEFKSDAITGDTGSLFCQMTVGGATFSQSFPFNDCVVPSGLNGPVMIHITSDETPLANSVVDRATTQLVAGPLLAFVDTKPQALGLISKSASSGGASGSIPAPSNPDSDGETTTTQTITPEEASSIISGATVAGATAASTSTGSAPVATPPAGNASSAPPLSPKPNLETGPSADGAINVNGWTGNI